MKDKIKPEGLLNAHRAEPRVHYEAVRSEDKVFALRDERPRGSVPGGGAVAGLTGAGDTQDYGFHYETRA